MIVTARLRPEKLLLSVGLIAIARFQSLYSSVLKIPTIPS